MRNTRVHNKLVFCIIAPWGRFISLLYISLINILAVSRSNTIVKFTYLNVINFSKIPQLFLIDLLILELHEILLRKFNKIYL